MSALLGTRDDNHDSNPTSSKFSGFSSAKLETQYNKSVFALLYTTQKALARVLSASPALACLEAKELQVLQLAYSKLCALEQHKQQQPMFTKALGHLVEAARLKKEPRGLSRFPAKTGDNFKSTGSLITVQESNMPLPRPAECLSSEPDSKFEHLKNFLETSVHSDHPISENSLSLSEHFYQNLPNAFSNASSPLLRDPNLVFQASPNSPMMNSRQRTLKDPSSSQGGPSAERSLKRDSSASNGLLHAQKMAQSNQKKLETLKAESKIRER